MESIASISHLETPNLMEGPVNSEKASSEELKLQELAQTQLENLKEASDVEYKKFNIKRLPGYKSINNPQRWNSIFKELSKSAPDRRFTVVDYGSDRGAFSMATAKTFAKSRVFSFDTDQMARSVAEKHNEPFVSSIDIHKEHLQKHGIRNNWILNREVKQEDFDKFNKSGLHFDVQYCLSFFHWTETPNPRSFDKAFVAHLKNANTSFFEMLTHVPRWYENEKNPLDIMKRALKREGLEASIKHLSQIKARTLYRIDLKNPKKATPANEVAARIAKLDLQRKG